MVFFSGSVPIYSILLPYLPQPPNETGTHSRQLCQIGGEGDARCPHTGIVPSGLDASALTTQQERWRVFLQGQ